MLNERINKNYRLFWTEVGKNEKTKEAVRLTFKKIDEKMRGHLQWKQNF